MKLGIKFASVKGEHAIPAKGNVELYDIATGEVIEGVRRVHVDYDAKSVILCTVELFPAEVKGTNEPLYQGKSGPEVSATTKASVADTSTLDSQWRKKMAVGFTDA